MVVAPSLPPSFLHISSPAVTHHGVNISGVHTAAVHHGSLDIYLVLWTDGDDNQGRRL